jgi:hypothetical protein
MTPCVLFCFRPLFPLASGLRACTPPPTFLTAFLPRPAPLPLLTTPSSVPRLGTITSACLGVRVTPTPLPLLLTSWTLAPRFVSSSGTPRITRGTGAWTLPPDGFSSLAMWCSMSPSFPFLAPPPLRYLTHHPCFPLTRWSSHLFRGLLQVPLRRVPGRPPVPDPQQVRARRPRARPRPLRLVQTRGLRPPLLPRGGRVGRRRRIPSRHLPRHLRRGSPRRYECTSAGRGRRRSRSLLHRGHRHHRRCLRRLVVPRRSTTRRCCTDTRGMFTRW